MNINIPTADLVSRMVDDIRPFGIRPAMREEIPAARRLTAELIGGAIAELGSLAAVHRRTGAAVFVAHEELRLTGVLALVLLSGSGEAAVRRDTFDALRPAEVHLAAGGRRARGLYAWGVASRTKDAAQRLIQAAQAIGRGAAAHLPCYARPTTAAGSRLMRERLGFVDLPGSSSGLVWTPPFVSRQAAA